MANTKPAQSVVRRFLLVLLATAASVSGLALLAGGGYMLFAGELPLGSPESIGMAAAEEVASPTPEIPLAITIVPAVAQPTPSSPVHGAQDSALQPTATPMALAEAATATPTRVAKATNTPVPVLTATPGSSELPDTGFGEFVQPLLGLGLVATAFTARWLRRHRP
jgi:hypothetical protein